jgi:hypothetical protein
MEEFSGKEIKYIKLGYRINKGSVFCPKCLSSVRQKIVLQVKKETTIGNEGYLIFNCLNCQTKGVISPQGA